MVKTFQRYMTIMYIVLTLGIIYFVLMAYSQSKSTIDMEHSAKRKQSSENGVWKNYHGTWQEYDGSLPQIAKHSLRKESLLEKEDGQLFQDGRLVQDGRLSQDGQLSQGGHKGIVHVAIDICDHHLEESFVLIKSIHIFNRNFVHVHLFVDEGLRGRVIDKIKVMPASNRSELVISIHDLTVDTSMYKPCNSHHHFFYAMKLPDVDAVIALRSHVLVLRPIKSLWGIFSYFDDKQLLAQIPDTHDKKKLHGGASFSNYSRYAINDGVLLLNLTRLRQFDWVRKVTDVQNRYADVDKSVGVLSKMLVQHEPEFHGKIPCEWNVRLSQCSKKDMGCRRNVEGVAVLNDDGGTSQEKLEFQKHSAIFSNVYDAFNHHGLNTDSIHHLITDIKQRISTAIETDPDNTCNHYAHTFTAGMDKYV